MRMSRVAAAFVLLSACVATPPADLPDRPIAGFDRAEARMDCAPWDGPAVTVTLSAASTDPDSVVAPYLHVSLWKPLDALAGRTWRWPQEGEQIGGASYCATEAECQAATKGVVWLDRIGSDSLVSGRLRLSFDGSAVAGSFRAAWRPRVAMCG